jgi:hypothetical protein
MASARVQPTEAELAEARYNADLRRRLADIERRLTALEDRERAKRVLAISSGSKAPVKQP